MSIWDALEKAAYTGLGLAAMTKDKLDEAVETLKKERGLTEAEGRRLADELKEGAETARRNLDDRIGVGVEKALEGMKLVSRKEVDELKEKIETLEAALAAKKGGQKARSSAD